MKHSQILLGGSFDPFHNGHLTMLNESIRQLSPNTLRILPCYQQALKSHQALSSTHRLAMLELIANQENKKTDCNILLDDFEISQNKTNYSIDTLKAFFKKTDDSLIFLMGEDSIKNIQKWKGWEYILDYCHIALVNRKTKNENKTDKDLFDYIPKKWQSNWTNLFEFNQKIKTQRAGLICQIQMDYVDISSSAIKENLENSQTLLPAVIFDYIKEHKLYK